MIGCDADRDSQFEYIEHLRKAFKIEPKRHLELFEEAESRPRDAIQWTKKFCLNFGSRNRVCYGLKFPKQRQLRDKINIRGMAANWV